MDKQIKFYYIGDCLCYFLHSLSVTNEHSEDDIIISHSHPRYEIMQLLEGKVTYIIDGKHYSMFPGDVVLVKQNQFHMVKRQSQIYRRRVIEFNTAFLVSSPIVLSNLLEPFENPNEQLCNYIPAEQVKKYQLNNILNRIERCIDQKQDRDILMYVHVLEMLIKIKQLSRVNVLPPETVKINPIVNAALEYIGQNMQKKITLSAIAKHTNVSKYYLSHLFKSVMGITLSQYVTHRKITYARRLIDSGVSPTEAAGMVGFENYSNFYSNYKKIMKQSPSQQNNKGER